MENGPGPVITNEISDPDSHSLGSKGGVEEDMGVMETVRKSLVDGSSLREAVLGIGDVGNGKKCEEEEGKETKKEEKNQEDEKADGKRKTRAYSGAWP